MYSISATRPTFIPILTRKTKHKRFPIVEEAISGMKTQRHIHDVIITVRHGQRSCRFNIFLKNHCLLPFNPTVAALAQGRQWKGDILVMRVGEVVPGVVNMRGDDARLADFAVRQ